MKRDKRGLGLGQLPEVAEVQILDFVGRGEWFYVGQVSKAWRSRYLKHYISSSGRRDKHNSFRSSRKAHSRRITSYKAVLASVPRLELAISNGFDVQRRTDKCYNAYVVAFAAGKYSDKEVLLWLKTHHAALWGESVCGGAIEGRRLELVKWLHEEQQCEWSDIAGSMAAKTNNLPMLKYIYSRKDGGAPTKSSSREDRAHFSLSVVISNNLQLLRWCHKKRLLADGFEGGEPILYTQSLMSRSTALQPWLFKHGYRLPADDDEYNDMMERHHNDSDSDSSSSSSDSEASSDAASSSSGSEGSGDSADDDSTMHDDDEESDEE
jgi:hypothetical protein